MFVLSQSQSYFWPVEIEMPVSGGKFEKSTFDAEFKRLAQSRIKEILKQLGESDYGDSDLCKEVLVGWKGILDENKAEVPFSESARDQLLDVAVVAGCIVKAFFASLNGAKRKN
jgi:hypothetical protein